MCRILAAIDCAFDMAEQGKGLSVKSPTVVLQPQVDLFQLLACIYPIGGSQEKCVQQDSVALAGSMRVV